MSQTWPRVGDHVIFVDPMSRPRPALVTAVWPQYATPNVNEPGVNVVLVSDDDNRDDVYGRQIVRETSVVHRANQPAPGNYWCRPVEYDATRDAALRRPAQ